MKVISDTNVLIAANGRDCPQVTPKCQLRTGQYLRDIKEKRKWNHCDRQSMANLKRI
jgi:hypothetical protein